MFIHLFNAETAQNWVPGLEEVGKCRELVNNERLSVDNFLTFLGPLIDKELPEGLLERLGG